MADAWIYSEDGELGGELARELAGLGYSPRRIRANASLLPGADQGTAPRRPDLVVVAAGAGGPAPSR